MSTPVALAPVARRDWSAGILLGLLIGGLAAVFTAALIWRGFAFAPLPGPRGTGAGWHALGVLAMLLDGGDGRGLLAERAARYARVWAHYGRYGAAWLIWGRLALIIAAAIAAGGWAAWLVLRTETRNETHASGAQLRRSPAGASKKDVALSPRQFTAGGLAFTLDRIRRSMFAIGSIGGGKTQVLWQMLRGLIAAEYRLLLVDGPKGDYSQSLDAPGGVMLLSPWHNGPAWDIARDCPTRNHARELARALIPVSEKEPVWGNAACMIFVAIVCKLQAEHGESWGWGDIYEHITLPIADLYTIALNYYPPAAQSLADAESKTTQSIVINLTAFMSDVFEMALAWANKPAKFAFCDWWRGGDGPQVVILQGSGEFKTLAGGYITAILQNLANLTASPSFAESKDRKNVVVIDEFAQLPKMSGFEKFFEIGRSKGCSAILATQSPAQVRKIWGEDDMQAWLAMIGTKVYCRILGHDDAELVIKELGEQEVYVATNTVTTGAGKDGQSVSSGWTKEKKGVVTQDELSELGPCKKGIKAIVQGYGKDPIETLFSYTDVKSIRPAIIPNPQFNRPIAVKQAIELDNTERNTEGPAEVSASPNEPAETLDPGVAFEGRKEPEPAPGLYILVAPEQSDTPETTETQADTADEIGGELVDNIITESGAAALVVDPHALELLDGLCKSADELYTPIQPATLDVHTHTPLDVSYAPDKTCTTDKKQKKRLVRKSAKQDTKLHL